MILGGVHNRRWHPLPHCHTWESREWGCLVCCSLALCSKCSSSCCMVGMRHETCRMHAHGFGVLLQYLLFGFQFCLLISQVIFLFLQMPNRQKRATILNAVRKYKDVHTKHTKVIRTFGIIKEVIHGLYSLLYVQRQENMAVNKSQLHIRKCSSN